MEPDGSALLQSMGIADSPTITRCRLSTDGHVGINFAGAGDDPMGMGVGKVFERYCKVCAREASFDTVGSMCSV